MTRTLVGLIVVLGVAGLAAFWAATAPRAVAPGDIPQYAPDVANGEAMFWAGGCESCHAAAGAEGDGRLKLGGGQALATPFGTFKTPNISPDPDHGIGGWTLVEFVNAMKFGVAPGGIHLYPAFPYTSYQRMRMEDIIDLKAFLDTLPAVAEPNQPHELPFPFNIRRGLGLWKRLYVDGRTFEPDPAASDDVNRGAYLVEGPAHCGECHTPRNVIGGPIASRRLGGGPSPDGKGTVPNITPDETGIGAWSRAEVVNLLATGFLPDFDVVGGAMTAVVRNTGMMSEADLEAIAAYLQTVPPVTSADK